LSKTKYHVDKISERNGNNLKFFFGLLVDFIGEYDYKNTIKKNENDRWMKNYESHYELYIYAKENKKMV
jgi:hypothetical protein